MTLLETIKRAALAAVQATNPVEIRYGIVKQSKPLEIEIHSKLVLTEEFLDVAEHLTRHERVVTLEHVELTMRDCGDQPKMDYLDTDDRVAPVTTYEHHAIKMIMEDGLKIGEKVVLVRMQGGHKFIVMDRYYEGKNIWNYPARQ